LQDISAAQETLKLLAADTTTHDLLTRWSIVFSESLESGGSLFFAGNGGSYADALHLAAEFTGKMGRRRPPLSAYALGSNGSSVSAIGNDYAFEDIFARELRALHRPHSALLVMSTSGNSRNILRLVETSRQLAVPVLAFTGSTGGQLKSQCDCVQVPSSQTERIQEVHILLGHILCGLVESSLAGTFFEWD
jgi:D-sedoheptulose 7-phosphate isomerase